MLKKTAAVLLALAILPAGAFACTAVYVGSNLTADGSTIFARQEEYTSDKGWPKLFEVIPEGAHKAGETYTGCYGFTWTCPNSGGRSGNGFPPIGTGCGPSAG